MSNNFELRGEIARIDGVTDYMYGLTNLYDASEFEPSEKKLIAAIIANEETDQKKADELFDILNAKNTVNFDEDCDKPIEEFTEALHGQDEIEQFAKMANQIGLKTMGDLKRFIDEQGEGKDVLTALKDYLVNDLGDINFQAKDESLHEDAEEETKPDFSTIKDGDKFNYKGIEFIRLGKEQGGILCITAKQWTAAPFDKDGETNNYNESSVKELLESKFLPLLDADDLLTFKLDLTDYDGRESYGSSSGKVGLLTADLCRKYSKYLRSDGFSIFDYILLCTPYYVGGFKDRIMLWDGDAELSWFEVDGLAAIRPICVFKELNPKYSKLGVISAEKQEKEDYKEASMISETIESSVDMGTLLTNAATYAEQFAKSARELALKFDMGDVSELDNDSDVAEKRAELEKALKVMSDAIVNNPAADIQEAYSDREWEEVASKSVEDSDGFLTDYVWYTDGNKHVFVFGDSDIYRPEDGDYDWEIEIYEGREDEAYKEAQEWFDSYTGFEDMEEDCEKLSMNEKYDDADSLYDIQGKAVNAEKKEEVLDEFKEIFADGDNGSINIDDEETKDIVKAFLEDKGYTVETSETNNPAYPIHIEWFK